MTGSLQPQLAPRRQPRQARSSELVASILQAAAQVIAKQGADHFTVARVAERAGVSVGSVYQYFPNKTAILFRLQADEWRQTAALLVELLADDLQPPFERLRNTVDAFIRSECAEAEVRTALRQAAPLLGEVPEAESARFHAEQAFAAFLDGLLPGMPEQRRALACRLVTSTLVACGTEFSSPERTVPQIRAYANALTEMLWAYLNTLGQGP